ncbi:hypothetical protein [uncultured Paenibacillus sp.]|uniref:hypothetical protein n=1 Tax=uncultured Paenibacillus sp. TaxID=227322 RepID=UPI0015AFF137|nr:hypothetical protein [uncultured Paenibacillus sp.]
MKTTQQENVKELLRLIEENPDLRITPMVDSEIVADDGYNWWLGSFGKAQVDEIFALDERLYIRSEDEDTLIEKQFDDMADEPNLTDEEAWEKAKIEVANYAWEKVIAVKINLP